MIVVQINGIGKCNVAYDTNLNYEDSMAQVKQ